MHNDVISFFHGNIGEKIFNIVWSYDLVVGFKDYKISNFTNFMAVFEALFAGYVGYYELLNMLS